MKSRLGTVYLAVLLISFSGYPLLVAAANLAGLPGTASSAASMVMRASNAGLALLLIFGCLGQVRGKVSNLLIQIFLVFWLAYFIRIFFDTLIYPDDLWQKPSHYWMWAVGGSFIPMLGLALWPQRVEETDTVFRWFFCATFGACLLALLVASGAKVDNVGNLVETGRARIGDDRLNPISLGHLGAMLVIQSIWAFIFFPPWRTATMRLFVFVALCVGQYILILANSRGPVVATVGCLVIVIVLAPLRQKLLAVMLSGIVVASISPLARYVEENHNITSSSRLVGVSISEPSASVAEPSASVAEPSASVAEPGASVAEPSASVAEPSASVAEPSASVAEVGNFIAQSVQQSSRLDLFAGALEGFWESPWIGRSLEIPSVGGYPHNVIIEAFMALGMFFGFLLVAGVVLICLRNLSLFSKYPQYSWPSLLFFQYFIGAQFSGSLYTSTYLWASIGLIVSLQMQAYGQIPSQSERQEAY